MAGADEALAGLGHVVADHARLDEVLAAPGGPFGLAVPNDADAAGLAVHFDALALIAAAFPAFADGRGFSLARRIRRLGFAGELWARGRLIPDQYPFARACGFDAVWVDDDVFARQDEADWRIAASSLSLAYQTGQARWAGAPLSILELRRELPRSLAAE
jgi:uncharacterized protein (DUF934 family)